MATLDDEGRAAGGSGARINPAEPVSEFLAVAATTEVIAAAATCSVTGRPTRRADVLIIRCSRRRRRVWLQR